MQRRGKSFLDPARVVAFFGRAGVDVEGAVRNVCRPSTCPPAFFPRAPHPGPCCLSLITTARLLACAPCRAECLSCKRYHHLPSHPTTCPHAPQRTTMSLPPPSPEATTSAILGASSSGWSPVRTARRPVFGEGAAQRESMSSDYTETEGGSPGKGTPPLPTHRANIAVLRSHGLVSNSIFKSGNPSPTQTQPSPHSSPSRHAALQQHAGQDQGTGRRGVGLGISASHYSPSKSNVPRTFSNSSIGSAQSTSDVENEEEAVARSVLRAASPRKSQGFKKLEKASYVSNSPFRRPGTGEHERPLELPRNAWAVSAAARSTANESTRREAAPERVGGVPRTPERTPQRLATAYGSGDTDLGTPTSLGTPRGGRGSTLESPSNRGLLVSNRLHGPRVMESSSVSASPQDSPTRRERRKTVTFDEVLDVQEFDRESSFDGHSLQSGSSQASSLAGMELDAAARSTDGGRGMWMDGGASKVVQRLMVVNASPDTASSAFSTPDLEARKEARLDRHQQAADLVDSSSTDSREVSSLDEPRSPPPEEASFEHEYADKSYNTAPDVSFFNDSVYVDGESDVSGGNLSAYGALHRVDSLVDELLEGDLLGKGQQMQQHARDISPPRRRRAAGPKLGEQERAKALPTLPVPPKKQQVELSLPAWSPLMDPGSSHAPVEGRGVIPPARRGSKEDDDEVEAELEVALSQKQPVNAPAAPTNTLPAAKPRTNGRPHISRDAVLQRVAREKKYQEEEQQQSERAASESKEEGVPQVKSQSALFSRRSEGAPRSASGALVAHKADFLAEPVQHAKAAPAPSPTKQVAETDLESPLERLSAEVAAEQNHAVAVNLREAAKVLPPVSESTRRQEQWFADDAEESGAASGRASSNLLGQAPPKLTPAQHAEQIIARRRSKNGKGSYRPRGRRSLSEGAEGHSSPEAEESSGEAIQAEEKPRVASDGPSIESAEEELVRSRHVLDASLNGAIDGGFETGLEREISRIYRQGNHKYRINDRGVFTSADEKVAHNARAGDVDSGKAWRKLRRPSDMNEYAKEMREYRENENPKKATGKVFVLVDSFTPSSLPVPSKPTRFYCILDNGLHVVKTATAALRPSGTISKIGQEFELIQHKNLEFSLTLIVQRDSHLQEPREESPTASRKMTPSFSRGMGKLFSSPKKRGAFASSTTNASMASSMGGGMGPEPMMAYMNREGALGRCDVVFDRVAQQSLGRCHTIDLPVCGVNDPAPSLSSSLHKTNSIDFSRNLGKSRGTLRLKLFYLPPMPSVPRNLMPQNLGDCIRGMEAARWHAGETWMEGTLTQLGGDCTVSGGGTELGELAAADMHAPAPFPLQSWRRRPVKAQGAHLIGFNEITKKPTIKIDLSKAVSIEETQDPVKDSGGVSAHDDEELDENYHVERSFRITFKDGERISFFADTEQEMREWLHALGKLVGNVEIPKNCVWASVAMEMIRTAREKGATSKSSIDGAATVSTGGHGSRRVPVKADDVSRLQQRSSALSLQPPPSVNRQPRLQSLAQTPLSAVQETTTPEQTPTRRRPVSAHISHHHQVSERMSVERPASVYVDR